MGEETLERTMRIFIAGPERLTPLCTYMLNNTCF